MSQIYSDPKRADDPHALPNVEVWEVESGTFQPGRTWAVPSGWYWRACFPGCLPDSDPVGPFDSEAEAIADAQEGGREQNADEEG